MSLSARCASEAVGRLARTRPAPTARKLMRITFSHRFIGGDANMAMSAVRGKIRRSRRDPESADRRALRRVPNLREDSRYPPRSEEHTSELQSLMRSSYAVFCLQKKNT